MNIQELANAAGKQINVGSGHLSLVLPPNRSLRYRYLAGQKSPRGQIVGDAADSDGVIVMFDPMDVLAWCCCNGATVTIVSPDGTVEDSSELVKQETGEGA